MANPKYVPAQMLRDPRKFGRKGAEWIEVSLADRAAVARRDAARVQHEASVKLRQSLKKRMTHQAFAAEIAWSPGRLSRALNGAAPVSLEDLLLLIGAVPTSLGSVANDANLAPDADIKEIQVVLQYLRQLEENARARIAHIERGHSST